MWTNLPPHTGHRRGCCWTFCFVMAVDSSANYVRLFARLLRLLRVHFLPELRRRLLPNRLQRLNGTENLGVALGVEGPVVNLQRHAAQRRQVFDLAAALAF